MNEDFAIFTALLTEATKKIGDEYIQLPTAGKEATEYRERVYCYELYHRLRIEMDARSCQYSLNGEVDKSGHRRIRGDNLDNVKPDLVVHKPGGMSNNLVAIEVKPIRARKRGIGKDLRTLTALRRKANYHRAIFLVYGGDKRAFERLKDKARSLSEHCDRGELDLNLIDLYWHRGSAWPAKRQWW